jgi:O-antigen/teichoic acid export membrane protein
MARTLLAAALPFGLLQLAQVLALDGDIFLARAHLPAAEAGYIGALSLFQRIQFFAFVALASVLLPGVVRAVTAGDDVVRAAKPVALLFVGISAPLAVLALLAPEPLIDLLVGEAFLPAAPGLALAVLSAIAFTFSYLVATFLAALGDRTGIFLVFAVAAIQLAAMAQSDATQFIDLVRIKAECQIAAAILVFAVATRRVSRHRTMQTSF